MATTPAAPAIADLSDIRTLAQKLFAQCKGRDAPNSYRLLATSVRNLRNALEEVEEDYDQTRTLGPDDVALLNQIGRSHDTLIRVDFSLQSYRSSGQDDVNTNAVSDLKTALDVATDQLKIAFEATTTGDIPLKLDTRGFPGHAHITASVEDSSASRSRKSSVWSLGNKEGPRSPGASDATSVHTDRVDRGSCEEKQLLSPSISNTSDTRPSMDFHSPFADPLSMGIEAATHFLLGGDDDEPEMSPYARPHSSRSRAASNVSATTERFVSAPASPEIKRKPVSPSLAQAASPGLSGVSTEVAESPPARTDHETVQSGTDEPQRNGVTTKPNELLDGRERATSVRETEQLVQERAQAASERNTQGGAQDESKTTPQMSQAATINAGVASSLDSSDEASAGEKPLPSVPSRPESAIGSSTSLLEDDAQDTGAGAPTLPTPPSSGSAKKPADQTDESADLAKDLARSVDAALSSDQQTAALKSLPPSPATQTATAESVEQSRPPDLPPPLRRPPPPPPPPTSKRMKPNTRLRTARSKYRIANDASGDSSSDEELYSSSQPSSPTKATAPQSPPVATPTISTPTIQIDSSALDDHQRAGQVRKTELGAVVKRDERAQQPLPQGAPQLPRTTYSPPVFAKPQSPQSNPQSPVVKQSISKTAAEKSQSPAIPSPRSEKSAFRPQSPPLPPSVQKRIGAAVRAGDRLLAKDIETKAKNAIAQPTINTPPEPSASENAKPPSREAPPVPPRPRSRYNRPRAVTDISSQSTLAEKEIAPAESGLELNVQPSKPANPRLVPRISVDHALNVVEETPVHVDGTRHLRSASTSQLPPPQFSLGNSRPTSQSIQAPQVTGWYGPGADDTPQSGLDAERIEHICHFWNNMAWDSTEEYLMAYLESLVETDNMAVAKRVRHLLGVCASFKGEFGTAITIFLSNLEVAEPSDLGKPGNCEAFYWLGDLYALQNQRLESLIAYSAAQWGGVFRDPMEPNLSDLIVAEQEAVQLGAPKAEFSLRYAREARMGCGSILDPSILPAVVVQYLFDVEPRRDGRTSKPPYLLDPNKPRSSAFFSLSLSPQIGKFRRNRVSPEHFITAGPWPLQYDPTFAIANVKRERLLSSSVDLATVLALRDGESKLPKVSPLAASRTDSYTCSDLAWLITAVRDCLSTLGMAWSEVANDHGAWFIVRHTLMDGPAKPVTMRIATVHYFAIAVFRQSYRSAYGVDICSHGVSSARIMDPGNLDYERGAHQNEAKRIQRLVKETLEEAEKRRPGGGKVKALWRQSSVGLGTSRSSSDDAPGRGSGEEMKAPGLPPRPKS